MTANLAPSPLICLEGVNLTLNSRLILHDVSFALHAGQCWAVLGTNGAGKSTFLKLVRGDIWPDVAVGQRRYAIVSSQPRESPIGVRERVALVSPEMQDRYVRLELPITGLELLLSGFQGTDYVLYPPEPAQLEQAEALLADFDLEPLRNRSVLEMSKGQLRRMLLARALVGAPLVLMLDEFFSGLDPESKARLMRTVDTAVQRGLTVMYTTHRLEESIPSTSHALELHAGRIVARAPSSQFRSSINAPPTSNRRAQPTYEPQATPGHASRVLVDIVAADVYLGHPEDDLTAIDGAGAPRKKRVLENIHWRLRQGEQWALVGHNGAGKSTLAKLVLGELEPAVGGLITRFGLERMPIWERQARIGLISSDVQIRHRVDATGFAVVASAFTGSVGWARDLEATEQARVHELLEALEIVHLAERNALATSHGELKKLLVARSLVTQPDIVILDEPFDYLDARSRGLLFDLIERETARSLFITVAHRPADIPPSVTHVLQLEAGRTKFTGRFDLFLETNPDLLAELPAVNELR